jgi:predicted Rossmann fold nucleotide-binding protein DprA/Smf involved in DNA uptake
MAAHVTLIESAHPDFPAALQDDALLGPVSRVWAIGTLEILYTRLLGFFCTTRCPGNVILRTYDLAQALRAASIPVIGGFHTPMEKECLDLLLRGTQPVVICPARSIERMRLPVEWRRPVQESRMLILSPFGAQHRRGTAALAEQRNRFVATLADDIFVAHAPCGSKTEQLCVELLEQDRRVNTLKLVENAHLMQRGAISNTPSELVHTLTLRQQHRS